MLAFILHDLRAKARLCRFRQGPVLIRLSDSSSPWSSVICPQIQGACWRLKLVLFGHDRPTLKVLVLCGEHGHVDHVPAKETITSSFQCCQVLPVLDLAG